MLRWVLASAKADEWLECTHPEVACADKEYDGDKVIFTDFQYLAKGQEVLFSWSTGQTILQPVPYFYPYRGTM